MEVVDYLFRHDGEVMNRVEYIYCIGSLARIGYTTGSSITLLRAQWLSVHIARAHGPCRMYYAMIARLVANLKSE